MRVYLDTAFLSRSTDWAVPAAVAETYVFLAKEKFAGRLEFVVSSVVIEEMDATTDPKKRAMLAFVYWLLPQIAAGRSGGFGTATLGPFVFGTGADPLFSQLSVIFDTNDARHVHAAVRGGCDYFLTNDDRTILQRARREEARLQTLSRGMTFGSPVDLAARLGYVGGPEA